MTGDGWYVPDLDCLLEGKLTFGHGAFDTLRMLRKAAYHQTDKALDAHDVYFLPADVGLRMLIFAKSLMFLTTVSRLISPAAERHILGSSPRGKESWRPCAVMIWASRAPPP